MHRHALTNEEWDRLRRGLPSRPGPRSVKGDRNFIEAVLWIAKTGSPWRDLPRRFGKWKTIFNRFNDWSKTGKWEAIFAAVAKFDGDVIILDGSIVRAHQDSCGGAGGPKENAIGRSRGGRTTKVHLAVDKKKRPVRILVSPGNDHDITKFDELIDGFSANACLADKAYDAKRVIDALEDNGIEAVIPARACSKARQFNEALYTIRYLVECSFHDLKRFRRIATRYEKTARNFVGFLNLACWVLWS